eukprot:TRINITY_DN3782_c0_g1_i1.p1 TRINITY_DN3782_c0_g1~~TRINITY_DN3782_c0_g1_i1.p1  ORF type:complete len:501 (+),score=78.72 TRINITY_DN3782_c0_g1_i1:55-1557(+)
MKRIFQLVTRNQRSGQILDSTRRYQNRRWLASVSNIKPEVKDSLRRDLEAVIGETQVSSSDSVRDQHGQDEGPHRGAPPDLVVFPSSTLQVSEICKICSVHGVPIVPHGTGTGLEGGTTAVTGGVTIDLIKNMEAIREMHTEDFCAVVEPGVTREGLNQFLKSDGLWFPVDPGANASICGMCATGASGTNAVRYGTIKENVLNLEVVLADGRIINTAGNGSRSRKTSAGYNLTSLMVGSEGTLGLITGATVKLHAIPESVAAAVVSFPDVQSAVDAVVSTLQCSVPLARVEFLDEVQMMACNKYSGLQYPEKPHLFIEFHGSESEVSAQAEFVKDIVEQHGGGEFEWAVKQEDRTKLWTARHRAYYADMSLRPGCKIVTTDVCVPISALPQMIQLTKEDISASGLIGPMVGHVGDGNFHSMLLFDPENEAERQECKAVADRMARRAISLGGTCTGEHGVGLGKKELLKEQFGQDALSVMKAIKLALDPNNLMNPRKILDV